MRFRLPIAAAALLAVAGGPLFAQGPSSSEKPSGPAKVAGKTLEQWVKEITDGRDPGRRQTAIRAVPYFGKAAAKEAVPALLAVLKNDYDVACRVHAAQTLANLAEYVPADAAAEAVRVLIDRASTTGDPQLIVRLHLVWALGAFGPRATAAIPVLISRIHDPNSWELRQAALSSLASVARDVNRAGPDKDAVTAVAKLLIGNEKSSQVRLAAVGALRTMGKPEEKEFALAKEALEKATRDRDETVAIWARVALMTLDKVSAEGLSEVVRHLKVKDAMIKVTAATALGALGREARPHIGDVADLLDDSDPLVVATAIDVLGSFGPAAVKAVPALRKVMEKKEHGDYFRRAAAAALKQITGVEEKLPAAGTSPSPGSSLTKPADPTEVGGKTLDQWIKEIRSNADPSVQETAMRVVPYFGKKAGAAAPALVYRLRVDSEHADIACRAHAILALAAIADHVSEKDAIEAVKAITYVVDNDGQAILRYHAVTALGAYSFRATSAIPALINRIHDPNSWEVREAAIASLTSIAGNDKVGPDPRATRAISERLLYDQEKSGAVRMMAVMALGALGRPANPREFSLAVQALGHARADRDKSVEIWGAVALMAVDRVTKEGLDEVAKHLKGKDVMAKLTAARALGAMGKEARPKVGDVAVLLDDDDQAVIATALDVLAGLGPSARDAEPALKRFIEKLDQRKDLSKEQREYFKEAAKYTIDQIDGARK